MESLRGVTGGAWGLAEVAVFDIKRALKGVTHSDGIAVRRFVIAARGQQKVMQKGGSRAAGYGSRGKITNSHRHGVVLIAVFRRNEPEGLIFDDGPANRSAKLFS